jgi:glucose-6-phosphate dehydrogenase assembly protein OpcA
MRDGSDGHDLGMPLPMTVRAEPARPNEPMLRWSSQARSIPEIEHELSRIWTELSPAMTDGDRGERRIAARTSVMNLVVIARRPETAQRAAATIASLTGRHPSRTIAVSSADPDGPSWIDAHVRAYCMLPRPDAPETCAEFVDIVAGGETGRHLSALVAPLLVHDLPVTVWWPGEPPFGTQQARDVLDVADRLVVDGSTWSGDGLARLAALADVADTMRTTVFDFALVRQARWREAIASVFDHPEFLPFVHSLRRVSVGYAAPADTAPGRTNVVKPVYHAAWLASRLGSVPREPLMPARGRSGGKGGVGLVATLGPRPGTRRGQQIGVVIRPVTSTVRPGTTLRVELLARRRGSELRADITAEAEVVRARVWLDGIEALVRTFRAPRLSEVDLLAQAIETAGSDPVTRDALRMAGALVGPPPRPTGAADAAVRRATP